jgi:hypothetical protein
MRAARARCKHPISLAAIAHADLYATIDAMLGIGLRAFVVCGTAGVAVAVGVAACGASANSASAFGGGQAAPPSDSGAEDAQSSSLDSSLSDAGTDAAPPIPPTVTFVHASPSLNDTRLCWTLPGPGGAGALTGAAPFPSGAPMPASNFPGLPVGGAVQLSPAADIATASAAGPVELYAIDAEVLAREASSTSPSSCEAVLCLENPNPSAPCLRPNEDYWHVGTLPASSIAASGPTFVALAGCLGTAIDSSASAARCGSSWDAVAGNLHVEVLHVATLPRGEDVGAASDAGLLAVQSALLSPAIATSLADGGPLRISFGAAGDASTMTLLAGEDDIEPPTPTSLEIGTDLAAFGQLGFGVDGVDLDAATSPHFWTSLAQAQSLVDPTADPRVYFGTNATYVAVVLGDPSAPSPFSAGDAAYDGRGLHVLILASLPAN